MTLDTKDRVASVSPAVSPAVTAAAETVKAAPSVSTRDLPDGGIAFDVAPPKRRNVWRFPVLCLVLGAVAVVGGYLMHVYNPGLPPGYRWRWPVVLIGIGALNVALAPLVLVVLVVQGPPRNVALEARPGRLKADRSIAGDRVVSEYGAGEVEYLFVEGGMLYVNTRKGDTPLIQFGERPVNLAIATLLASRLWQPDDPVGGNIPELQRWVVMSRPRMEAAAARPADR